jgi:DNA-binding CsgD family transcriptional regulator/tetratricopeptide (TPR) repeat protein
MDAFAARAAEADVTRLRGAALALDRGVAYAPIVSAWAPLAREAREDLEGLDDLARLFPGLALQTPAPLGDVSLERTRLYESLVRLTSRRAQRRPVVVLLDDLHWGDDATLQLLNYLARGLTDDPVLLVVALRPDEPGAPAALRSLVDALERNGAARLSLGPLSGADALQVASQVAGVSADELPSELGTLLVQRARGNPLFTRSLVAELLAAGHLREERGVWTLDANAADAAPSAVKTLLAEKLARVDDDGREVLEALACAGGNLRPDVLAEVIGREERALPGLLEQLFDAGLVEEIEDGRDVHVRWRHPLFGEVTYDGMRPSTRQRTHFRLFEALARREHDPVRLADQAVRAGARVATDRQLELVLAAATRAEAVVAHNETVRFLEEALRLSREGAGDVDTVDLLERLGDALFALGEIGAAVELWSEALAAAEGRTLRPRLAAKRARSLWELGDLAAANAAADEAVAEVPAGEGVTAEEMRMFNVVLRIRRTPRPAELARFQQLLAGAPKEVQEQTRAETAFNAAIAAAMKGDHEVFLETIAGFWDISEPLPPAVRLEMRTRVSRQYVNFGWHDRARRASDRLVDEADALGTPLYRVAPWSRLAHVAAYEGDFDAADGYAQKAATLARRLGALHPTAEAATILAHVALKRGRAEEFDAYVAEALEGYQVDDHREPAVGLVLELFAHREELAGDAAGSLAHLEEFVARLPSVLFAVILPRFALQWCRSLVDDGQHERALALATTIPPIERTVIHRAVRTSVEAHVAHWRGDLALGRPLAREALSLWEESKSPYDAAWLRVRCAEQIDEPTDGERAELKAALAALDQMGALPAAQRARKRLEAWGITAPAPRPKRTPGLLSARELEVAQLAAEGLTNAQIGKKLFISPYTVKTHLQRVYGRLEVSNRGDLGGALAELAGTD